MQSFVNIVQSKSLWATDVRYLNDYKELNHATELADSLLRKRYAAEKPKFQVHDLLNAFLGDGPHAKEFAERFRMVAISLSENGDQLSQWRGYCHGSVGVSIGFASSLFDEFCLEHQAMFDRCIYAHEVQQAHLELDISNAERELGELDVEDTPSRFAEVAGSFVTKILREAIFMKHGSFSEENEWRFADGRRRIEDCWRYRPSSKGLIPYIDIPFDDGELPIREVIVSPSENSGLQVAAVQRFVEGLGIHPDQVRASEIPFRG